MFAAFKAYPNLLRANWALAIEYRAQVILLFLGGTFPIIMMAVWMTIAKGRSLNGFSESDFIAYFLGVAWVRRINFLWLLTDIEKAVQNGELSAYIVRPMDYAHHLFTKVVASRFFNALVVGAIIAVVVLLVPGRQFDLSPINLLCAVIAIAIGFVFEFVVQMMFGALAFWTTQMMRIHDMWWFVKGLLGGFLLPVALLPEAVRNVAMWLPFQASIGLPVEILIGRASPERIATGLAIGVGWTVLLFLASRLIWKIGLRSYSAVGA